MDNNIGTDYNTNILNGIIDGIESWNISDAPSISCITSSNDEDVVAIMDDFGETGWDGYSVTFCSGIIASSAYIYIFKYISYIKQYNKLPFYAQSLESNSLP